MQHGDHPKLSRHFPEASIDRLTRPVSQFLRIEAASGVLLALCAVVALVVANSSLFPAWQEFWQRDFTIGGGALVLSYPRWYWVNDALMAIFFFVVGLEIKRELVDGHLADRSKVLLPVVAALGGALVPAGLFYLLQRGTPGVQGWAIPMATDIAFVVGALALLGKRIPPALKVLLLSLAIVDDLLAVGVIAFFFAESISPLWLGGSVTGIVLILILQRVGVRRVGVYVLVGVALWLCTLKSGLHPTIAGVILGLLTPARPWLSRAAVSQLVTDAQTALEESDRNQNAPTAVLDPLALGAKEAISPLERLEHSLHPYVGFLIMPIFALANSGVPISMEQLSHPLSLSIAGSLLVGKPLGICFAAWLAVRFGGSSLPKGVNWKAMLGAGVLCGTGFTMSLFIASFSFEGPTVDAARTGVLLGSAASLVLGMALLAWTLKRPAPGA
ncbi:MAG: Na+/H+ antiporter NhaA [Planctomycetes bacterium]|nr:Na+/H+ antiporter NhaA [Planctomycetota bacterium]MCB9910949.1 Na+/H+ antiporter NhaA [Planctomycetota bacterium]MCB9911584.1 Na+/H+ antiporter NhaA [Planctomycetota bacterium]HPF13545.1 Na+/H+ antiporter NhaA [Planctomycetota bacterium]HRV80829.1 Na+/H+ antiporter NhaA [Planctomycetota bacterium]